MTDDGRSVHVLRPKEVETLVDWAAGEGWNPGLHDAAAFRAADPDGFLGAFVNGEMVAGISAVAYGDSYGFIGLYISRPDMRGKGHGKAVWGAGMRHLEGRTIGLDGVDEQFENYRGKGFSPVYRTIRFGGRFGDGRVASQDARPVLPENIPALEALDRRAFPAPRDAFLARWLAPPHVGLMVEGSGGITAYGVMRKCREGWKIGGLVALDLAAAKTLVAALAARADGDIHIDVPAPRSDFAAFLAAAGLAPGFETTRMYLGEPVPLSPVLFGVTSLELG